MPELTLSLPAAMGLLAVFVVIGAITLELAQKGRRAKGKS